MIDWAVSLIEVVIVVVGMLNTRYDDACLWRPFTKQDVLMKPFTRQKWVMILQNGLSMYNSLVLLYACFSILAMGIELKNKLWLMEAKKYTFWSFCEI